MMDVDGMRYVIETRRSGGRPEIIIRLHLIRDVEIGDTSSS